MTKKIPFSPIVNELKNNLSLSLPLITSQLIYSCSGFIGTAMIARLGEDALAASVLVSTIWMSLLVLFFGILNAVSVLVAHQYGAKNYQEVGEILGQAFILGLILTVMIIISLYFLPWTLDLAHQSPKVLRIAFEYIHALIWTVPGLMMLVILEQFLTGINRARLVLRISLLVVPVEILSIYVLIFGKLGFPQFGVAGIGYGFAFTNTLSAGLLFFYLYKSKKFQTFSLFTKFYNKSFHYLKELIHIGVPIGCMHLIEVSAFAIMTFWIARFGTTSLAAHQIVLQYLTFAITIIFAMSQAITIRVGHEVGRKNLPEIKRSVYVGMGLNFSYMLFITAAFILVPHFFLRLDINIHDPNNRSLIIESSDLLFIGGILMLFDNFRLIGFGALRGLKDTKFPMYASFMAFWVIGLNLSYYFAFHYRGQAQGVWWGITLGIAIGAVIILFRLHFILKRVDLEKILGLSFEKNKHIK